MAVEVRRFEVWSNAQAAGGARLAVVPDVLSATDRYELNGQETIRLEIRRESAAWQYLQERRVLRALMSDDTWREWRITDITESRSASQLAGQVEAEAVKYDLAATLMERVEADGTANPYFELYGLTPAQHLATIVSHASSYFSAGTVGSSAPLDMVYDWDSPMSAVHALAYQANLELSVVGASTGYTVNLPQQAGSTAETVYLRYSKNLEGIERDSDVRQGFATRVYPRGGGAQGERPSIANAQWLVASVSSKTVVLSTVDGGAPIAFADQLNGLYVEEQGGTRTLVADSRSTDQAMVLASAAHNVAAGERVWLRRNSSGAQLTYLDHPANSTTYGRVQLVLDRDDIPAVDNLVENPFLDTYSTADKPDDWVKVNSAETLSESTSDLWYRYGTGSLHVVSTAEGHGVQTAIIPIYPSTKSPHFTAQIALRVESGAVRLELVDTSSTQGGIYPPADGERARTTVQDQWVENLAVAGINLQEVGSTGVRLRITAHTTQGAEWYLDAAQVTQSPSGEEVLYGGRGSNHLWLAGNSYLASNSTPRVVFNVAIADLHRLHPGLFPTDKLVPGGTVQVTDADLGLHFTTRIVELRRNLYNPAQSQVKLSNLPEDLVGQLGGTARRTHKPNPPGSPEPRRPVLRMDRVSESSTRVTFKLTALSDGPLLSIYHHTLTSTQPSTSVAFTRVPAGSTYKESGYDTTVVVPRSTTSLSAHTLEAYAKDENGAKSAMQIQMVNGQRVGAVNIPDGSILAQKLTASAQTYGHDIVFTPSTISPASSDSPTWAYNILEWSSGGLQMASGSTYHIVGACTPAMGAGKLYYVHFVDQNEAWTPASVGLTTADLSTAAGNAIAFNDQWNGYWVQDAQGGRTEITDSAIANQRLTMASSTHGLSGGVRFTVYASSVSTAAQNYFCASTNLGLGVASRRAFIAVCKRAPSTQEEPFWVPGVGVLGLNSENIRANSIQANQIAANAITASKINVLSLSAISADLGTVTAGQLSANVIVASSQFTATYARFTGLLSAWGGLEVASTMDLLANNLWWFLGNPVGPDFGLMYSSTWASGEQRITMGYPGNSTHFTTFVHNTRKLGFYGSTAPITKPSAAANAAALQTALKNLGLISTA